MILAEKIMNERKKNGWSQEELAEQLSVSRQSISKWEGAQAIPDIQKIIKMAELFSVSTDYLLKDEMEPEEVHPQPISGSEKAFDRCERSVSMEEANDYLNTVTKIQPHIANGVSLCILSPVLLIVLAGLTEIPGLGLSENAAAGIGIVALFLMIAAAVLLFIVGSSKLKAYEYLDFHVIDTEYGVTGMVTEKKKAYENTHTIMTAIGVLLCILCVLPLLISAFLEAPDYIITTMVGLLLVFVSTGVNLLVRTGGIWESYEKLLQENEYSIPKKKDSKIIGVISRIYWLIATAIYLGWSFWTMRWDFTWLVWPVAGVLFGVVVSITRLFLKSEDE